MKYQVVEIKKGYRNLGYSSRRKIAICKFGSSDSYRLW